MRNARPLGAVVTLAVVAIACGACGASTAPDPRHPARPIGCAVKSFAEAPNVPVDELGAVEVDCSGEAHCARKLIDEVCKRGGDIVWGLGDNTLTSMKMKGHAAHTAASNFGPRAKGCDVEVRHDAPVVPVENIGTASATCAEATSDDDCTRQLQDEACRLGGNVLWGVNAPVIDGTKKKMSGRVAHTK